MKVTPKNVLYHNLVGLHVRVASHPDEGLEGLSGKIVDETKNFIVVDTGKKLVSVQKLGYFEFTLPDGKRVLVRGETLKGRPEDRLKRFLKA